MACDDAATAAFANLDALNQAALELAADLPEPDLPSFESLTSDEQALVRRVLGSALGADSAVEQVLRQLSPPPARGVTGCSGTA